MSSAHSVSALTQSGRRLYARRRMEGLVYMDLGPNNGALLIDLGEGGLSFQSVAPVSMDQAVPLKFKLSGDAKPIEGYAEVAWLNESQKGGGLRFVELSANALDQIRGWAGVLALSETVAAVPAHENGSKSTQPSAKERASAHAAEESIAPQATEAAVVEATVVPPEVSDAFAIEEKAQPPSPETPEALHAAEAAEQEISAAVVPLAEAPPVLEFLAELEGGAASPDPADSQLDAPPNEAPSVSVASVAENAAAESSLPDGHSSDSTDGSIDDPVEIAAVADAISPSSLIPPMAAGREASPLLNRESQTKTATPGAPASDVPARPAGVVRAPEPTPKSLNPVPVAPPKPARSPASHSKTVAPAQKRPRTPTPPKTESPAPPAYRQDSPVRGSFLHQPPRPAAATAEWERLPESEPESKHESSEAQATLREALRFQSLKIGIGVVAGACLVLALVAAVPSLRTRVQATANSRPGGLNLPNTPAFEVEVADLNNRRWILRSGGEAASLFADSLSRETRPGASNSSAKSSKSKGSDGSADAPDAPGAAAVEDAVEATQSRLPKPGVLALSRPVVKQSNAPPAQPLPPSIFDGITPPIGSLSGGLPANGPGVPGIVPPEGPETARRSTFQAAVLVQHVAPVYPSTARALHIQGNVTVSATIGKDGVPKNLKALTGDPRLVPAALAAISQWRYRPSTLAGEPMETQANITVSFELK